MPSRLSSAGGEAGEAQTRADSWMGPGPVRRVGMAVLAACSRVIWQLRRGVCHLGGNSTKLAREGRKVACRPGARSRNGACGLGTICILSWRMIRMVIRAAESRSRRRQRYVPAEWRPPDMMATTSEMYIPMRFSPSACSMMSPAKTCPHKSAGVPGTRSTTTTCPCARGCRCMQTETVQGEMCGRDNERYVGDTTARRTSINRHEPSVGRGMGMRVPSNSSQGRQHGGLVGGDEEIWKGKGTEDYRAFMSNAQPNTRRVKRRRPRACIHLIR